jgi:exopolyphosphatase/pppGpp-phosphohydrolase
VESVARNRATEPDHVREATMNQPARKTTRLDIGDLQTGLVVRNGEVDGARLSVLPGAQQLADKSFRHEPPRPVELESAIDVVEDQLTAAVGVVPTESSLVLLGPLARQLAQVSGGSERGDSTVSIETVEGLFQRLASESFGNPAARRGLPAGNIFVAGVLILREFMHHLAFESVTLEA